MTTTELALLAASPAPAAIASAEPVQAAPLVLVIDDDAMMRMLVREALEAGGFRVEEAEDGEVGLELLPRVQPDAVLLDVVMPGMDGFEPCVALRSQVAGARIPVLMMTGLDDTASVNRAYECGATDFVTKPIAWPILPHRVRYMLRARQAFEALAQSEERLAEAQQLAQLGHWDWNLERAELHRSDELLRILGVRRDQFQPRYEALLPLLHADDRAVLANALAAALQRAQPFSLECRLLRADGSVGLLHEQAVVTCDAFGKPVRIHGTTQDITERRRNEERLRTLALYDPLTGLPNREFFNEQFGHSLAHAERIGRPLAVMLLDIDRFKRINETFGHGAGDQLLKEIGARLAQTLRDADYVTRADFVPADQNLARLGGDEFTIMLASMARPEDVAKVARRILETVSRPVLLNGEETVVTVSIGIAVFPADGTDADTLLKNADSAMYFAKDQGKNNYQFFSSTMNAQSFQKLSLENGLRKALERDELRLHYQPKIDAMSGRISGVEALIRWQHPDLGMVAPNDFIPLAEETGLIVPIGEWVLHTACAQLVRWHAAGHTALTVAVNMASANFAQQDFVDTVAATIRGAGLARQAVEIEVTESVLMQDMKATIAKLHALKAVGVQLSVDDFGIGYSSLAYLKRFPIDTLKIDRSFVRDVIGNREDSAITTAIIALGQNLGLQVVAEGVETEEQAAFLRQKGCHLMQGYLFGRPVPAADISRLLAAELAPA